LLTSTDTETAPEVVPAAIEAESQFPLLAADAVNPAPGVGGVTDRVCGAGAIEFPNRYEKPMDWGDTVNWAGAVMVRVTGITILNVLAETVIVPL
jgi:hypothetical protein